MSENINFYHTRANSGGKNKIEVGPLEFCTGNPMA
jgi:hypothetical protein